MSDDDNNFRLPPASYHAHSSASSDSAAARPAPSRVPRMHLAMDVVDTLHRLLANPTVTPRTSKRARLQVAASWRRPLHSSPVGRVGKPTTPHHNTTRQNFATGRKPPQSTRATQAQVPTGIDTSLTYRPPPPMCKPNLANNTNAQDHRVAKHTNA
ncbi:hypothetical protein MBLNU13_g04029t1 [Cladosporium sp. NU13]